VLLKSSHAREMAYGDGKGRFTGYRSAPARGARALTALPQGDKSRGGAQSARDPSMSQSPDGGRSTYPTRLQALTLGHVSEASRLTAGQAIGSIERAMLTKPLRETDPC